MEAYNNEPTEEYDQYWLDDDTDGDQGGGRVSMLVPRKLNFPSFADSVFDTKQKLQVFVRLRPTEKPTCVSTHDTDQALLRAVVKGKDTLYRFTHVFGAAADQTAVFKDTAWPLVRDLLLFAYPSTAMMAYGVTCAGKTHTMEGSGDAPGLVPQALRLLFRNLQHRTDRRVYVSVVEVYNETIYDLLAVAGGATKVGLKLKEDRSGHMYVKDLGETRVDSEAAALEVQRRAARVRQSAGTGANQSSSRSHCVFNIRLARLCPESGEEVASSTLSFVDLAGCERVSRTGNQGVRLKESVAINSSLMTLGHCLKALREGRVLPYREAKLTSLFKDALTGRGRLVLCVCVNPETAQFEETRRVLQYAALASKIEVALRPAAPIGDDGPLPMDAEGAGYEGADGGAGGCRSAVSASKLADAHGRIEALIDEKADLEYDLEVLQRQVELLKEQLLQSELEKQSSEAEVRQEVMAEVAELMRGMQASHKTATDALRTETADLRVALRRAEAAEAAAIERAERAEKAAASADKAAAGRAQQNREDDAHSSLKQRSATEAQLSAATAAADAAAARTADAERRAADAEAAAAELKARHAEELAAAEAAASQRATDLQQQLALYADQLETLRSNSKLQLDKFWSQYTMDLQSAADRAAREMQALHATYRLKLQAAADTLEAEQATVRALEGERQGLQEALAATQAAASKAACDAEAAAAAAAAELAAANAALAAAQAAAEQAQAGAQSTAAAGAEQSQQVLAAAQAAAVAASAEAEAACLAAQAATAELETARQALTVANAEAAQAKAEAEAAAATAAAELAAAREALSMAQAAAASEAAEKAKAQAVAAQAAAAAAMAVAPAAAPSSAAVSPAAPSPLAAAEEAAHGFNDLTSPAADPAPESTAAGIVLVDGTPAGATPIPVAAAAAPTAPSAAPAAAATPGPLRLDFARSFLRTVENAVCGVGSSAGLAAVQLLSAAADGNALAPAIGDAGDAPTGGCDAVETLDAAGLEALAGRYEPAACQRYLRVDLNALAAVFYFGKPAGYLDSQLRQAIDGGELASAVLCAPAPIAAAAGAGGRKARGRPKKGAAAAAAAAKGHQAGSVALVPLTVFPPREAAVLLSKLSPAAAPVAATMPAAATMPVDEASEAAAALAAPAVAPPAPAGGPAPKARRGAKAAAAALAQSAPVAPVVAPAEQTAMETNAAEAAPEQPSQPPAPSPPAAPAAASEPEAAPAAAPDEAPPAPAPVIAAAAGRRQRAHASTLPPAVAALAGAKLQARGKRGRAEPATAGAAAADAEPIAEPAAGVAAAASAPVEPASEQQPSAPPAEASAPSAAQDAPAVQEAAEEEPRPKAKRKLGRAFSKFTGAVPAEPTAAAAAAAPAPTAAEQPLPFGALPHAPTADETSKPLGEAAAEPAAAGRKRKAVAFAFGDENAAPSEAAATDKATFKVEEAAAAGGAMTRKRRQSLAPALAAQQQAEEPAEMSERPRRGRASNIYGI